MTSAELLELFNDLTGRGATDVISDTKKYRWLKRAQDEVISEIATFAPKVLYPKVGTSALPALSTTDSNVFTFGTDTAGDRKAPIGDVQIYRYISDVPDRAMIPGVDYIDEGDQIRLPRNRVWTGPLYYRGILMPLGLSAAVGETPALIPGPANELTALRAGANFAESGNLRNAALADRLKQRYMIRLRYWALVWKRQFSAGGVLRVQSLRDLLTVD